MGIISTRRKSRIQKKEQEDKGGEPHMGSRSMKKNRKVRKKPIVAPGLSDEVFGEDASREDLRKGNYTKVTRVFLDENDPGF